MTRTAAAAACIALGAGAAVYPWLGAWALLLMMAAAPFAAAAAGRMEAGRPGGRPDPFEVIYAFVAYLFFGMGVRGVMLVAGRAQNRFEAPVSDVALVCWGFALSALALASLYAGYGSKTARGLGRRIAARRRQCGDLDGAAVTAFIFICAAVGFASFLAFYARFSSVIRFGYNPATVAALSAEGGSVYITTLANFPLAGALISLARGRSLSSRAALALNLAAIAVWFVVAGRKNLLIELMLGAFVVRHYLSGGFSKRRLAATGAVFLVVSSAAFYFRDMGLGDLSRWADILPANGSFLAAVFEPMLNRSYHFDSLLISLDSVSLFDNLKLGGSFKEIFYFFVPRALWAAKPVSFGYAFGLEFLDPSVYFNTSYATSLPGELYINFHVAGVLAGFFLLGVAMRALYFGLTSSGSALDTVIYGVLFVRLVHLVEGPGATHAIFALSSMLPFAALFALRELAGAGRAPGRMEPCVQAGCGPVKKGAAWTG